jgi:ribosomal protein L13E
MEGTGMYALGVRKWIARKMGLCVDFRNNKKMVVE